MEIECYIKILAQLEVAWSIICNFIHGSDLSHKLDVKVVLYGIVRIECPKCFGALSAFWY